MELQILAVIFRSLAALATDPALGYRGNALVAALQLVAVAVEAGAVGVDELKKLEAQLREMIDQNREPTKAEWAELKARSEAAHLVLHA